MLLVYVALPHRSRVRRCIIARDVFNNYVWKGGEQFQVYAYSQVNLNSYVIGTVSFAPFHFLLHLFSVF